MVKTTVYLRDENVAALRRMAARTGRSQAELIREAVAAAAARAGAGHRKLHSAGVGHGGGEAIGRQADEILRRELGQRKL